MHSIGAVLYAYFVCEEISRRRPMTPAEARAARASWDALRAAHLVEEERVALRAGGEQRERALRTGRRRYAAWAAEHPEEVKALRRMAAPGRRRA